MRMNWLMAALGFIAAIGAGAPSWAQSGRPQIAGYWEGGFSCKAGSMGVSLAIEEAGDELRARLRFFPTRNNPRAPEGEVEMTGRFDRTIGSFELKPTRWIRRARNFNAGQMAGLFEGGKLSGQIRAAGCGGFTLARAAAPSIPPAQAAAAVADSGPVSLRDATTLEQSCGVVLRWVRRLKQEYPDLDLMRTPLNQIFPRAANLYRDKYFVPVFGTPFLNTGMAPRSAGLGRTQMFVGERHRRGASRVPLLHRAALQSAARRFQLRRGVGTSGQDSTS
jgi:hypothetical protein